LFEYPNSLRFFIFLGFSNYKSVFGLKTGSFFIEGNPFGLFF